MHARTLLLIALVAAAACDSSGTSSSTAPTAPGSSSTCRTFPTAAAATVTAVGFTQSANLMASFSSATAQEPVTLLFTNGQVCSSAVHNWRSVSDFVDEVRVIPPLTLETSTVTTLGGVCGSGSGTVTYTYDAQRRLTQVTGPAGTTTYRAWDASGRPTSGTLAGGTIANVYNDATRTATQTQVVGGVTTITAQTFDANGALLLVDTVTNGVELTIAFTSTSTQRVCK